MIRRHWVLPAVAATVLALANPALADDAPRISLSPPQGLLGGVVMSRQAGTWYQSSFVQDSELQADLTFQMPSPGTGASEPGPVVLFWQLVVVVPDNVHGDVAERKIGPPEVAVAIPTCDVHGNCAVRSHVSGPVAPALAAADLDWAGEPEVEVAVTLVRTFAGGSSLQVVAPGYAVDGSGGSTTEPSDMFGVLDLSALMVPADVTSAEVPSDAFHIASEERYDWGSVVAAQLADFVPPASPEQVPINVWTPSAPASLHVRLQIDFTDTCSDSTAILFTDETEMATPVVVVVNGERANVDVSLPLEGRWNIALTAGGQVLNATGLQPVGGGTGVLISGPIRCSDGKGVFTQEGIPQVVPNPSQASPDPTEPPPSPTSSGSGLTQAPTGAPVVPLVAGLGLIVIAMTGLVIARRH